MKLKQVRALLAALALVVGTALCISTVTWAKSLNPDPISIINEQGEIVESTVQSDRTLYFGSTVEQDITKTILQKLCTADAIKKDSLTAKDVSITLKSELVFDEEKNEFVESENDIKDVMTIKDDEITFSKTGFFLAEVSIKDDKCNVIFDIDDKVLAYADLNDWVVWNNTKSPDFSVKFDSKEIKSVKYDDSKVKVGTDGKYVLTYTITDAENHVVKKDVLVTVGDKKVVNELSEKGVWVAEKKIVANNSNTTKPVVKPSNQNSNNGSNNQNNNQSSNQDNNKPNKPEKPQHVHAFGDWQVKKAATCDKTGLEERFCTDTTCNKKEVRKTPALGHALTETVITEPTCGTAGSKEITCSRCDYKETKEIPATGKHAYGDWVVVKEATCTEDGLKTQTCTVCGDVQEEVIAKVDHTWNEGEITKQPTCTEDGIKTFTCTVCGDTKTEVITATGHTFGEWVKKSDPTCESAGIEERTCASCKETETREIPALGHEFVDYKVTKEPTCTEEGTETAKCTRCDKTDTRPVKALGHAYDNGVVTTEPTCEKDGVMTFTCTREGCTDSYTEAIPATGHTFGDWFYASEDDKPTCTEKGLQTRKCTNENCDKTETQEVDALGHDLKEEILENATCGKPGSKKVTCEREGCTYEEIVEIPATGEHTLQETILKQPTCGEPGLKSVRCTVCGYEDSQVEIPATGNHTFGDWETTKQPTCSTEGEETRTCNVCGHKETRPIAPTGQHNWSDWEVTKQPNCGEPGEEARHCQNEGCTETETRPIAPSTEHKYGNWQTKTPATCTQGGVDVRYCNVCSHEDTRTTAALGHDMVDGESTPATCLTNGLTSKHCTRCDHHEDTVIPALGHKWNDVAEQGHWDITTVLEERYICNGCGASFEDIEDIMIHTSDVCGTGYRVGKVPVEKKTWIVDVPAHKECERCHVTQ